MKNVKKALSLLIVSAILLTMVMVAVPFASAATEFTFEVAATKDGNPLKKTTPLNAEDVITVTVALQHAAGYNLVALQDEIVFDTDKFELVAGSIAGESIGANGTVRANQYPEGTVRISYVIGVNSTAITPDTIGVASIDVVTFQLKAKNNTAGMLDVYSQNKYVCVDESGTWADKNNNEDAQQLPITANYVTPLRFPIVEDMSISAKEWNEAGCYSFDYLLSTVTASPDFSANFVFSWTDMYGAENNKTGYFIGALIKDNNKFAGESISVTINGTSAVYPMTSTAFGYVMEVFVEVPVTELASIVIVYQNYTDASTSESATAVFQVEKGIKTVVADGNVVNPGTTDDSTLVDAIAIMRSLDSNPVTDLTSTQKMHGDVNDDGSVDSQDALQILMKSIGLIDEFKFENIDVQDGTIEEPAHVVTIVSIDAALTRVVLDDGSGAKLFNTIMVTVNDSSFGQGKYPSTVTSLTSDMLTTLQGYLTGGQNLVLAFDGYGRLDVAALTIAP